MTSQERPLQKLLAFRDKHERIEEALLESQVLLRKIFEYSNDAILLIDPKRNQILEVNPKACSLLGFTEQELLSQDASVIHPDEMPQLLAFADSVFHTGSGWTDKLTCLTKSGKKLPTEISASVIDIEGRRCLIALVRDISDRKRMEQVLRESEGRFRSLMEHAGDALFLIEPDGKIITVNEQACKQLGYTRQELLKMLLWDFSIAANPEQLKSLWEQMQPDVPTTLEGTHQRKDGRTFPVEVRVCKFKYGDGPRFLALARDVTERKRAEEALHTSEKRYRTLYNHTPVMMHSANIEGKLIGVNDYWLQVLGYDRAEVIGRSVTEFLTQASQKYAKEVAIPQTIKTGSLKEAAVQMVKKNGEVIDVLVSATWVDDKEKQRQHSRAFLVDVTARKRAEQALRDSEERLSGILESAMDAIITIDDQQKIVLFNHAAEKVFGCTLTEIFNQTIDRFLSDGFRHVLFSYLSASNKGEHNQQYMWTPRGLTAVRNNGEEFSVEATISEVIVSGRKLFTIILRDIEARLKAEAELNKLQMQNIYLQEEIKSEFNFGEIISVSPVMKKVFENIEKVASTDTTVLLTGETGTGKELLARTLHHLSNRRDGVLININCGALPSGLVESELFGHEKGAFTGATARKKGRFELADSGTIFLDEVGELPLETQTKLLRVLQEQEFERVGGAETIRVNVRVIAATNRDLEKAVKLGAFRPDLYYRLNIFPIRVPPLRERAEDIPLLANHFIQKFSRRMAKRMEKVSPQALDKLQRYPWPGNVRELANVLERAIILCEGGVLKEEHIGISLQMPIAEAASFSLEEVQRQHILRALEQTGGVLGGPMGAAKLLGVNRSTLWSRMKKLGITAK